MSTSTIQPAAPSGNLPEFISLPSAGPDSVFGLSRRWWYDLEAQGLLRLVRLRKPGNIRGRVLLPVAQAREAIMKLNQSKAA